MTRVWVMGEAGGAHTRNEPLADIGCALAGTGVIETG